MLTDSKEFKRLCQAFRTTNDPETAYKALCEHVSQLVTQSSQSMESTLKAMKEPRQAIWTE